MYLNKQQTQKIIDDATSKGIPAKSVLDNFIKNGYQLEGIDSSEVISNLEQQNIELQDIQQQDESQNFNNRISSNIEKRGETLQNAFSGTGEFEDRSAVGRMAGGGAALAGSVSSTVYEALPETIRNMFDKIGKGIGKGFDFVTDKISDNKFLQEAMQGDKETLAKLEDSLQIAADLGLVAGEVLGTREVIKAGNKGVDVIGDVSSKAKNSIFKDLPKVNTADEVIEQVAQTGRIRNAEIIPDDLDTAGRRLFEEQNALTSNISERWVGIPDDVKNQIAGKPELTKQYIDVVQTRNRNAASPTVAEFAGDRVRATGVQMRKILNEKGSEIGNSREKFSTLKLNQPALEGIDNAFSQQLNDLNLTVSKGKVVQKPQTPTKVGAKGDITAINDLYQQIKIGKQSPTLENWLAIRDQFSNKINFSKRVGDVSGSVDPISRSMRFSIKEELAGLVGKSEASKLAEYADYIDALSQLEGFTKRKAGAEYLLRNVLSSRGGEARKSIQLIEKYTGVNLLDDAVMMNIATDLLANESQKGLFRQEITKAGLDASRIMAGDPTGAIPVFSKFVQDKLFNAEEVLQKASQ